MRNWAKGLVMRRLERIKKRVQNSRLDRRYCDPDDTNGTVFEIFPSGCRVRLDDNQALVQCTYRRATLLSPQSDTENRKERTPVCVGDRVKVRVQGSSGVVEHLAPRLNELSRVAPGREESHAHTIVSNLDLLCIVSSVDQPVFNPGIVDRYLIAAEAQDIEVALVVNKSDLLDTSVREPQWEIYTRLGYRVFLVSASKSDSNHLADLREHISGKRVAFCGHSGVGKTSLLSTLIGRTVGLTGSVSESSGKGRHTTTQASVVNADSDSIWIDTPGVRSFGLMNIEPEDLKDYFRELKETVCSDTFCLHLESSEGCRAPGGPRLESYRRIYHSLLEGEY